MNESRTRLIFGVDSPPPAANQDPEQMEDSAHQRKLSLVGIGYYSTLGYARFEQLRIPELEPPK